MLVRSSALVVVNRNGMKNTKWIFWVGHGVEGTDRQWMLVHNEIVRVVLFLDKLTEESLGQRAMDINPCGTPIEPRDVDLAHSKSS
jgi:hypothetical protein